MNRTDELMRDRGVTADQIHLPAGGVAIFGRSGNGKSSMFYGSRFLRCIAVADTGSQAHGLFAGPQCAVEIVDATLDRSPVDQVRGLVESHARAGPVLLDSWSTLEQQQCAWKKRVTRKAIISQPVHQEIVGQFRDLALLLAQRPVFTVFNTSPGGVGKTSDGTPVTYPAGCITGYPSLNGMNPGSETILARWGNVWGVFQGHAAKELPRGLYVPGKDIRPEDYARYAPLKDPLGVIADTSGAGIMAVPDLRDPANAGRCFVDELLIEIAARFPKRKPPQSAPAADPVPAAEPQPQRRR